MDEQIHGLWKHDFDPEHRCPKCLHAPAQVSHRGVIGEGERSFLNQPLTPQPEHLRLECLRCEYIWVTDTADNAAEVASR